MEGECRSLACREGSIIHLSCPQSVALGEGALGVARAHGMENASPGLARRPGTGPSPAPASF